MPAHPSRRKLSFEKGKDTPGLKHSIQKLKVSLGIVGKGYWTNWALIHRLPDVTKGLAAVEDGSFSLAIMAWLYDSLR